MELLLQMIIRTIQLGCIGVVLGLELRDTFRAKTQQFKIFRVNEDV